MKTKVLVLLITLGSVLTASGQTAKEVQQEVRTIYAQAMEKMKRQLKDPQRGVVSKITSSNVNSMFGYLEITTECFYLNIPGEEKDFEKSEETGPYFIREKVFCKDSEYGNDYNEFLFHPQTGKLIFHYFQTSSTYAEEPVTIESRYYFDRNGKFATSLISVKSKETGKSMEGIISDMEPPTAEDAQEVIVKANKYLETFQKLRDEILAY